MTSTDRFERQLPTALAELAGPRTPDYFTDILGLTKVFPFTRSVR